MAGSSDVTILNKKKGVKHLLKELFTNHWQNFLLITAMKINLSFCWWINAYTLQANQKGSNSVYYNGMILGFVSTFAFLAFGFVMRWINFFKLNVANNLICFFIAVVKLLFIIFRDKWTAETVAKLDLMSVMLSYIATFSLDSMYNCFL